MKRVLSFVLGFLPMPCRQPVGSQKVSPEDLGLVIVDGPLVLALPERRAGMAVSRLHLARRQRHLEQRGLRLLPVQLLDDVLLGEQLDLNSSFAVSAVLRQGQPADRESTKTIANRLRRMTFPPNGIKVCSPFPRTLGDSVTEWGRF